MQNHTSIIYLLVHLWIPKFAPEDVAKCCELRNRCTSPATSGGHVATPTS